MKHLASLFSVSIIEATEFFSKSVNLEICLVLTKPIPYNLYLDLILLKICNAWSKYLGSTIILNLLLPKNTSTASAHLGSVISHNSATIWTDTS